MGVSSTTPGAESVEPPAAADVLGQVHAMERLDECFLDIVNLFPNCAARQLATQRIMECNFWLAQSLQENP